MRLRLTFDGEIKEDAADGKHLLRKCFHMQLSNLWDVHPRLKNSRHPVIPAVTWEPLRDYLAREYVRNNYNYVPLVRKRMQLDCALHILMLRTDAPGSVIRSGDLDNRVKTIIDGLRMHQGSQELGAYPDPEPHEKPFFCLLEDDDLVTRLSIDTDTVLQPPQPRASFIPKHYTRLVITVDLSPSISTAI